MFFFLNSIHNCESFKGLSPKDLPNPRVDWRLKFPLKDLPKGIFSVSSCPFVPMAMRINKNPPAPNILNEPIICWLLSVFPVAPGTNYFPQYFDYFLFTTQRDFPSVEDKLFKFLLFRFLIKGTHMHHSHPKTCSFTFVLFLSFFFLFCFTLGILLNAYQTNRKT